MQKTQPVTYILGNTLLEGHYFLCFAGVFGDPPKKIESCTNDVPVEGEVVSL